MIFSNVDAYIFSWGNYLMNAKLLQSELSSIIKNVFILHSGASEEKGEGSVIYLSENHFFGDQFKKCSDLLENSFLFHIQADTKILDLNKLKDYLEKSINLNVGISAPNLSRTGWSTGTVSFVDEVQNLIELPSGLKHVTNTDCTAWIINSIVLSEYRRRINYFPHFGWGIDLVMCALSRQLGLPVIRDTNLEIFHESGTGYSIPGATEEYVEFIQRLPNDIKFDLMFTQSNQNKSNKLIHLEERVNFLESIRFRQHVKSYIKSKVFPRKYI
jgi:hypothetical protein